MARPPHCGRRGFCNHFCVSVCASAWAITFFHATYNQTSSFERSMSPPLEHLHCIRCGKKCESLVPTCRQKMPFAFLQPPSLVHLESRVGTGNLLVLLNIEREENMRFFSDIHNTRRNKNSKNKQNKKTLESILKCNAHPHPLCTLTELKKNVKFNPFSIQAETQQTTCDKRRGV